MNRKLSLGSIFGTLFFLIMTLLLGVILYITADFGRPETWLYVSLFIGMFIGLLIALGNINTSIKLNDHLLDKKLLDINLHSCPDYWTRHTVINEQTNQPVVMCYNHIEGTSSFVYGDMKRNSPEFDPNFTSETLNDMRQKAVYKVDPDAQKPDCEPKEMKTSSEEATSTPVVETFQTYRRDDPDYEKYKHTHTRIDRIVHSDIANHDPNWVEPHEHVYLNSDRGSHSHGVNGENDNASDELQVDEKYRETDSNFSHWINPYQMEDDKRAMEINLTKLNTTENLCDLSSPFAWIEAQTKCRNVKRYVPPVHAT
jgi:hypothetical protein